MFWKPPLKPTVMMPTLTGLLRGLGRLLLALLILAGLLHFLVISNLTGRLVNEEVYFVAIDSVDVYNRIYDEVLVDEALQEQTGNLLGGVQLGVHDEAVALLREVLPPAYLQEQTEANIGRLTGYMNGDAERLEIYLELEEPLERVLPAAQDRVSRAMDALDVSGAVSAACTPENIRRLAADTAQLLQRLSSGRLLESAPPLQAWAPDCREQGFGDWLDSVASDPAIDPRTSRLIVDSQEELRQPFIDGDTRALFQAAATSLIEPLAQDGVANIRGQLQPGDRLDLIQLLADHNDDLTRADIEESAESLRAAASASNGLGRVIALVVAVVGSLLLASSHRPDPAAMLRWPGVLLALGGAVCLIAGYVLNLVLPGILRETAELESYGGVAPSAVRLAGDLLESFGQQATTGFVIPTVAVILVGTALVVASFLVSRGVRRSHR